MEEDDNTFCIFLNKIACNFTHFIVFIIVDSPTEVTSNGHKYRLWKCHGNLNKLESKLKIHCVSVK